MDDWLHAYDDTAWMANLSKKNQPMAPSTPLGLAPETFHPSLTTTGRIGMKQFCMKRQLAYVYNIEQNHAL